MAIYAKTKTEDDSNGMLFVKFASPVQRETAMNKFNGIKSKFGDKTNRMNPDTPIQNRVPNSFLLSFKKLLVSWGFSKSAVQVDTSEQTMSVEGEVVLKACVKDLEFQLDWIKSSWSSWKTLAEDVEYLALLRETKTKLQNAKQRMDKGKGKGELA